MNRHKILVVSLLTLLIAFTIWLVWDLYRQNRTTYLESLVRKQTSFPISLLWETDLGHSSFDRPVYKDGLVLMPAKNILGSRWYGINTETGEIVWSEYWSDQYSFQRCVIGEYLVLSGPQSFLVINIRLGSLVWEKERASIASCSNDTVFFSEVPRESIQAIDLATGEALWIGTTPRKGFSGLIYNFETDELVAKESTLPGDLYAVEAETGTLLRSFNHVAYAPEDNNWRRGPMYLIDRGELFLGGTVLDANTGEVIHRELKYGSMVPPTVTTDTMYLPAFYGGVVAFDRNSYEIKWNYPSPQDKTGIKNLHTLSQIVIFKGVGYVIYSDATLRAFDLETGRELGYWQPGKEDLWDWRVCTYPNPRLDCIESARAGLATSDDTLFVSFGDGKLYAFGADEP